MLFVLILFTFAACDLAYISEEIYGDTRTYAVTGAPRALYLTIRLTGYIGIRESNPVELQSKPKATQDWTGVRTCQINDVNISCYFEYSDFNFDDNDYQVFIQCTNENATLWVWGAMLLETREEPFAVDYTRTGVWIDPGTSGYVPLLPRTQYVSGQLSNTAPCNLNLVDPVPPPGVVIHSWDGALPDQVFGWGLRSDDWDTRGLVLGARNTQASSMMYNVSMSLTIGWPTVFTDLQAGPEILLPLFHLAPYDSVTVRIDPKEKRQIYWSVEGQVRITIEQDGAALVARDPDPSMLVQSGKVVDLSPSGTSLSLKITSMEPNDFVTIPGYIGLATVADGTSFDLKSTYGPIDDLPPGEQTASAFFLLESIEAFEWSLDASEADVSVILMSNSVNSTSPVYEFKTTDKVTAATRVDVTPEMSGAVQLYLKNSAQGVNATGVSVFSFAVEQFFPGSAPKKKLSGGAIAGIVFGVLGGLLIVVVLLVLVIFLIIWRLKSKKATYEAV